MADEKFKYTAINDKGETLFHVKTLSHEYSALTISIRGRGKALTMTMTPWNLTHGQWSKNLTMATDSLESAPWSMVKIVVKLRGLIKRLTF